VASYKSADAIQSLDLFGPSDEVATTTSLTITVVGYLNPATRSAKAAKEEKKEKVVDGLTDMVFFVLSGQE